MLLLPRPVAVAVAAFLAGSGLVLFDPAAPAALALAAPPPPVAYPTSVLAATANSASTVAYGGANANLGRAGWNNVLAQNPRALPTGGVVSPGGRMAVRGVSTIAAAAFGLDIGSDIAKSFGISETGNFFCDLSLLTTGSSGCAVGPAESYVPNSDIVAAPNPGWANGVNDWCFKSGGTAYCGFYNGSFSVAPDPAAPGEALVLTGTVWSYNSGTDRPAGVHAYYGTSPNSVFTGTTYNRLSGGTIQWSLSVPSQIGDLPLREIAPMDQTNSVGPGQATDLRWRPRWEPSRPASPEANPLRWYTTEWLCSTGATQSTSSGSFTETDPEWPAPSAPSCDPGAVLMHVLIRLWTEGLSEAHQVFEWTAPQQLVDALDESPECAGGACDLILEVQTEPGSTRYLSCFSNPVACADWYTKPDKADVYRCRWGQKVLALSECDIYAPTFKPTPTGQPGDYADPAAPSADPAPDPAPDPNPEADNGCPPPFTWSSIVSPWWYYKSTMCALEEAFVPKTLPAEVAQLVDLVQTKTPFPELVSVAGALEAPEGGTVCMVLALPLGFVIGHDVQFLDSCTWSDPVSQILRDWRPLLGAAVWVATLSPLAWWAWRQYAPGASGTA